MLNFYLEILLKKLPEAFRQFVTKWRFWLWYAPIVIGYFVADSYRERLQALQEYLSIWWLFWVLVLAAVSFPDRLTLESRLVRAMTVVQKPSECSDDCRTSYDIVEQHDVEGVVQGLVGIASDAFTDHELSDELTCRSM